MTDTKPLWEHGHPYYCCEGNFFHSPSRSPNYETHVRYDTWEEFFDEWGSNDPDLNLLFRWDWSETDPDDYEAELAEDPDFRLPGDELKLYFMLQRKALGMSVYVAVTKSDEPAVRAYLTERAKTVVAIWEPFLQERETGG